MSNIQRFNLAAPTDIVSISVSATQEIIFMGQATTIRVAYDEAELADGGNFFLINFQDAVEQVRPFRISGAMEQQRSLFIRSDLPGATQIHIWLVGQ